MVFIKVQKPNNFKGVFMKSVKALTLALALSAGFLLPTKKADAGVLLIESGGTFVVALGYTSAVVGALAIGPFMLSPRDPDAVLGWIALGGLALVVLDETSDQTVANLSNHLKVKYPMINDASVMDEIASMISSKVELVISNSEIKDKSAFFKLEESELRSILDRIDQTGIEKDVEKLVSDLI